jgi:hypothetical protein
MTRICGKSNSRELASPLVLDKSVAHNAVDVLDRIVSHQVVRRHYIFMPFKADYLAAVGITPATYIAPISAVQRICDIYQTARTGRLGGALGGQLWAGYFSPLAGGFAALPAAQPLYDAFATHQILMLADLLRQHGRGDFGHAQKMFNLFLKDHWALNTFPAATELFLHLPLDRIVLSKLANIPAPWSAWTRVAVTPATQPQVLATYLQIQTSFRAYWQHIAPRFASPLEMEQFIWHRI